MDEGQNNENRGINRGDTNGHKGKKPGDKKGNKGKEPEDNNGNKGKKSGDNGNKGKKSGDNNGNKGKKSRDNNGNKGKKPRDESVKYLCRAQNCGHEFEKLRGLYNHLRAEHKKLKVCPEPRCSQVLYTEHEEDDHVNRTKHGAAKTAKELLDKQGK